jgi:transposase
MGEITTFVGLDVHKATIAVAVARGGLRDAADFLGTIENTPAALSKLLVKLGRKHDQLSFCYEAGPCGYGVHRQLIQAGHTCSVVAPSLIPRRAGDRVKTDRRDAVSLAQLHRAGELSAIWVPDAAHEAMRDLVRARLVAVHAVRRGRQQLSGFLLRHGRVYDGKKAWTRSYRIWLAGLRFEHAAQQIVLQDYIAVVADSERRRDALGEQIRVLLPEWSMAPVVTALQALRGVALVVAATLVAEIGDLTRFDNPRQLMAHLGSSPRPRARRGPGPVIADPHGGKRERRERTAAMSPEVLECGIDRGAYRSGHGRKRRTPTFCDACAGFLQLHLHHRAAQAISDDDLEHAEACMADAVRHLRPSRRFSFGAADLIQFVRLPPMRRIAIPSR